VINTIQRSVLLPLLSLSLLTAAAPPLLAQGGVRVRGTPIELRGDSLHAPMSVRMGNVPLAFRFTGERQYELRIYRLTAGVSVDSFVTAGTRARNGHLAFTSVGGPGAPADSGRPQTTVIPLSAGRYMLVAAPLDNDGALELSKHRYRQLTVVRTATLSATPDMPSNTVITIGRSSVKASVPIRPGATLLRIENEGRGEHGLAITRLHSGTSRADAVRWLRSRRGERPFDYVAGTSPMSPGRWLVLSVPLGPGEYMLLATSRGAQDALGWDAALTGMLTVR
jgi:hypothetical protein